jgi:hypothetical protein
MAMLGVVSMARTSTLGQGGVAGYHGKTRAGGAFATTRHCLKLDLMERYPRFGLGSAFGATRVELQGQGCRRLASAPAGGALASGRIATQFAGLTTAF